MPPFTSPRLVLTNFLARRSQQNPPLLRTLTKYSLATFLLYHTYLSLPYHPTTGPSMLPTLLLSDGVLWSPFHRRGRIPLKVGDIVTAASPYEPGAAILKRVVGVEGDIVCAVRRSSSEPRGVVVQDLESALAAREQQGGRLRGEGRYIVVPKGHVWVEGDNLPWSVDSRHYGPLPLGLVMGKVVAIRGPTMWSWRWVGGEQLENAETGEEWGG